MDARDAKRQRLSNFENCCTDKAEHHDARLATELAAAEDVHGLLLLESGLHTVLAQPDAECAKVVGFLSRPSTCERLVHELLLSDVNASNSDPEAADVVLGEGEGILASLVASDAGRAAFAASCVLGGGVPEIAATLATSDAVWRALVIALAREQSSLSVQLLATSMVERMCRSFFLRAGSKAREGFVVMAKRHGLLQVALDRRLQTPQLLLLLPLIYRHDHSPKRYAFWASLELGLHLTSMVLAAPTANHAHQHAAAAVLLEHDYACEALVEMCEWSTGDRSREPGLPIQATSSASARHWGLSLLAELAESTYIPPSDCGVLGETLVDLAAKDCTISSDVRQQSPLLGIRIVTAVLSLSASLRQPTSSHSHAAIALATSVAAAIPQIVATLDKLATAGRSSAKHRNDRDEMAITLQYSNTDVLIQAVRLIGAASDMVASCGCGNARTSQNDCDDGNPIEPLRSALVRACAPTVLMRLFVAAVGGTLAAPHILQSLKHIWAAPIVRNELFVAEDWWTQWCLPLVERASSHVAPSDASSLVQSASCGTETETLPSFGHIVALSCLCDANGTALKTEVVRQLTLRESICVTNGSLADGTDNDVNSKRSRCGATSAEQSDGQLVLWRRHLMIVSAACAEQAEINLRLTELKRKLKQQKQGVRQTSLQGTGECEAAEPASTLEISQTFASIGVKRMPIAD